MFNGNRLNRMLLTQFYESRNNINLKMLMATHVLD